MVIRHYICLKIQQKVVKYSVFVSMHALFMRPGFALRNQNNTRSFSLTFNDVALGSDCRACDASQMFVSIAFIYSLLLFLL